MRADELLPDERNHGDFGGVTVRKGTVGAFLINARVWLDAAADATARQIAQQDIVDAVPALHALGLFDVLAIRDDRLQALVDSAKR